MSYFNEHIGAAENGNPNSQFQVANAYYNGEGVFKDHGLAVKWWRKAAEQGHILAQRDLAHAYSLGKGVAIDKTEAAQWYLRAADQGDRSAQFQIGLALFDGIGIAKNTDLSIEYLRKAALAGHKGALQFLSNCARHLISLGLTPDSRFNLPQKTGCLLYIIGSGMLGLLFLVVCL